MAYYKRRYTPRKRNFRRRPTAWYNKKYSAIQIAKKAARGVWYLKGLVNSEKFKHDIQASSNPAYSGTLSSLVAINQGDGDGQRTGNSIFVRSVSMKGSVEWNSTQSVPQRLRMMLVIDKQQVGDTIPSPSDVLDTTGTSFAPYSMLNDTTVGRFTILKSRMYNVSSEKPVVDFNWNINLRHHVRYNGTTSSDIQKGGLYLLLISDAATNGPTVFRFIRVSYHDN